MKRIFQRILSKSPRLYHIARSVYRLRDLRCIILSRNSLSRARLEAIQNSAYNDIVNDLVAYTEFSAEELLPYLQRSPEKHFESEFDWHSPKNERELTWFYRCSSAYMFANAVHPYDSKLDIITEGRVLDYGAGVGCNTIGLAKRNLDVDFLEICRLQADFINFRAERHKLKNVREVRPYYEGTFNPVLCIRKEYDAIVAIDVLEHIPNYHVVVKHFIEKLKPGGIIIERSPFDPLADEISIHVRPSLLLEEAMVGMERIDRGIWRKQC